MALSGRWGRAAKFDLVSSTGGLIGHAGPEAESISRGVTADRCEDDALEPLTVMIKGESA